MHLYNINIVSLTQITIFLRIVPTVELASLSASTHCLEGFALLCIITPKSISSFVTFYSLPQKTHKDRHKERVGIS